MTDQKVLCKACCRDGTGCLNKGKFEGYCWKHNEIKVQLWHQMLREGADVAELS